MPSRPFPILLTATLALSTAACSTTAPPSGFVERKVKEPTLGSAQLDVLVVDATIVFSQEVERAADRIIAGSPDDLAARINALRWKTYAISAAFSAGGHSDPAASLLDLWVLCAAQQRFFEEHATEFFGNQHTVAVDVAADLSRRVARIGDAVTASPEARAQAHSFVEKTAATNPVTDLYFVQKTLDPKTVQAFTTDVTDLVNVAYDLQKTAASLQRLLRAHAAILPRQIRWQAELATFDLGALYGIDRETAAHEIERLQANLESLATAADQIPEVVAKEREAALRAIEEERAIVLRQLDGMLRQTQGWASGESATLRETLSRERALILTSLDQQRVAAVRDVETAARRATDEATVRLTQAGRTLIREALIGLLLLWVIVLLSGAAAVLLIRRLSSERKPAP